MVQILGWTDRGHSKLVRHFSKKLLTDIFGCPKLTANAKDSEVIKKVHGF